MNPSTTLTDVISSFQQNVNLRVAQLSCTSTHLKEATTPQDPAQEIEQGPGSGREQ